MRSDFRKKLITVILIALLAAAAWYGLKWFGETSEDGSDNTGHQQYEQQVSDVAK